MQTKLSDEKSRSSAKVSELTSVNVGAVKLAQLASWNQLDHSHAAACLRSLTLTETELCTSLNLILLGTKFSGRTKNGKFIKILK